MDSAKVPEQLGKVLIKQARSVAASLYQGNQIDRCDEYMSEVHTSKTLALPLAEPKTTKKQTPVRTTNNNIQRHI